MSNMREEFINALRLNFKANIEKHRVNVESMMCNSVGIGEHGNVMKEIEKEMSKMADYSSKLEMLDYFEAEVGPNKTILND